MVEEVLSDAVIIDGQRYERSLCILNNKNLFLGSSTIRGIEFRQSSNNHCGYATINFVRCDTF